MGFQSSLSPIDSIPSGDLGERQSSSSSVVSDDLDGDVGLLMSLLSPPSVGSMTRASVSSDFSFYSAVDSPTGLPQAESVTPVLWWRLGPGRPISVRTASLGCRGFWPWMCFSQHYPQAFGFRSTFREVWSTTSGF